MNKDDKKSWSSKLMPNTPIDSQSTDSESMLTESLPSIEMTATSTSLTDGEGRESLIEFPTRFPIKAIGKHEEAFIKAVHDIVAHTIPTKDLIDIKEHLSSHQRFLSYTITATFYDQTGIDRVYQALSDEPSVLMAL